MLRRMQLKRRQWHQRGNRLGRSGQMSRIGQIDPSPGSQKFLMTPKLLSSQELAKALHELRGWSEQGGKLHRQFDFSSFEKALGFMSGLAIAGEAMAHHPQESNLYNCVTVELRTDEAGGITNLDLELARQANQLAASLSN